MTKREQNKVTEILDRYFSGKYPPHLQRIVQKWLASGKFEESKDAALKQIFDRVVGYDPDPGEWSYEMLADLHRRASLRHGLPVKPGIHARRRTPLYRSGSLRRIAAVLIPFAVVAGALLWILNSRPAATPERTMVAMSVPDTLGACRVGLMDGSSVFVSPGSEIAYAEDFDANGRRLVKMIGEAYFSVAKDSLRPFVVEAGNLNVNVMGTTFNVQSSPGQEFTTVTLYTGQVVIDGMHCNQNRELVLTPGQRMVYNNATCEWRIEQISDAVPGWIAAKLDFDHSTLDDVFRALEWYYGVKIADERRISDKNLYSFRLTGREDLDTAMKLVEHFTLNFSYSIEGDTVRLK